MTNINNIQYDIDYVGSSLDKITNTLKKISEKTNITEEQKNELIKTIDYIKYLQFKLVQTIYKIY